MPWLCYDSQNDDDNQISGMSDNKELEPTLTLSFEELTQKIRAHQYELESQNEELRRVQTELVKTKAHFVDLYDNAPVGYLTLDDKGEILELNLTAATLLGQDRAKIIGKPFAKFVAAKYKDLWHRHFQYAKAANGKYGCELPFTGNNGEALYYHLDCLFNADKKSPATGRITLTDVTTRRQAEEQQRIAAAAFETQDCIIIADAEKRIERVNKAFCRITGYRTDEAIGLAFFNSKRHKNELYQELWAAIARDGHWRGELWDKRKTGESFLMAINITAVKDKNGGIGHYVADFIDITKIRRDEEALRIAAAAFESQESILVTDSKRVILRVNEAFTRITGYSPKEAIGRTPRILRSGYHDKVFYDNVLATVAHDGYWKAKSGTGAKMGKSSPSCKPSRLLP